MQGIRRILMTVHKHRGNLIISKRNCSTSLVPISEVMAKKNYIFSQEQKRQLEEVGRVKQISVEICGPPEDAVLMMNEQISTPYDCCKHISLPLCDRSALALIDEKILWDMHRPLPGNCRLKFLSFRDKDPYSVNEAFWRTGSFLLGAVITKAFKDGIGLTLREFPECRVNTGSFFYDVIMDLKPWTATPDELKILSAEFLSLTFQKLKIERLSVKKSLALKIFEDNPFKAKEIIKHAEDSTDNLVTLYRVGDYIDICAGPLVANTSFFGRATVTAVHHFTVDQGELYRFQAVALPKGIMLNQYAYGVLTDRGAKLNEIRIPDLDDFFQPYTKMCLKNSNTPLDADRFNVHF